MKIVGTTTSEEECKELTQIIKTFVVAQRARTLATTKHHHPEKHHPHPPPHLPKTITKTEPIHQHYIKGLT